ncbi:MAG: DUF5684 domain-containing protein [Tepidisphaeraceae bacterium]|jgi:hypothetical protein
MGAFVIFIIELAIIVLAIAGMWKSFEKAGKPGWAAIIPIYNLVVILEIAGKPLWWIILCLIPIVNLVIIILIMIAFAEKFGKGAGFGVGLAFLGFIFFPMLGFGDAQYVGGGPGPQGFAPVMPVK